MVYHYIIFLGLLQCHSACASTEWICIELWYYCNFLLHVCTFIKWIVYARIRIKASVFSYLLIALLMTLCRGSSLFPTVRYISGRMNHKNSCQHDVFWNTLFWEPNHSNPLSLCSNISSRYLLHFPYFSYAIFSRVSWCCYFQFSSLSGKCHLLFFLTCVLLGTFISQ